MPAFPCSTTTIPPARANARLPVQIGYSMGNMGKSLVWASFDSFLLYYLVTFCSVTKIWGGALLALLFLCDGCADLLVSYLSDRRGSSNALGRLIKLGAPLCGLGFWLTFAGYGIGGIGPVLIGILACRIGYTMCDIGHNTILVRFADNPHVASTVSGMRLVFSALGGASVGFASAHLLAIPERPVLQSALALSAAVGGSIYVATLSLARWSTRQLTQPSHKPVKAPLRTVLRQLWSNHTLRFALATIALQSGVIPLFNRALAFYGEAVAGNPGWAGIALTTITLGQSLSLPIWMALGRRYSAKRVLIAANCSTIAGVVLIGGAGSAAWSYLGIATFGMAQAGMNMAVWAIMATSVNAGRDQHGEALPIGAFLAVLKISAGLGTFLLSTILLLPPQLMAWLVLLIPICGSGLVLVTSWGLQRRSIAIL